MKKKYVYSFKTHYWVEVVKETSQYYAIIDADGVNTIVDKNLAQVKEQ